MSTYTDPTPTDLYDIYSARAVQYLVSAADVARTAVHVAVVKAFDAYVQAYNAEDTAAARAAASVAIAAAEEAAKASGQAAGANAAYGALAGGYPVSRDTPLAKTAAYADYVAALANAAAEAARACLIYASYAAITD